MLFELCCLGIFDICVSEKVYKNMCIKICAMFKICSFVFEMVCQTDPMS